MYVYRYRGPSSSENTQQLSGAETWTNFNVCGPQRLGDLEMSKCSVVLIVMLSLWSGSSTATAQQDGDVWSRLQFKTAWIPLGPLEQLPPHPGWISDDSFSLEIDGQRLHRLPVKGEHVHTVAGFIMVILDYRISGEKLRNVSPATRVRGEDADDTGLHLPAGFDVVVEDVQVSQAIDGIRLVWVRVSPAG